MSSAPLVEVCTPNEAAPSNSGQLFVPLAYAI
uniref:Uncharacterized protein n=1 Tax=Arundo donax TaxID=35708 RepID=A0A0A9A3H3_ARUDO